MPKGTQNASKMEAKGNPKDTKKWVRINFDEKSADLSQTPLFAMFLEDLPWSQTINFPWCCLPKMIEKTMKTEIPPKSTQSPPFLRLFGPRSKNHQNMEAKMTPVWPGNAPKSQKVVSRVDETPICPKRIFRALDPRSYIFRKSWQHRAKPSIFHRNPFSKFWRRRAFEI